MWAKSDRLQAKRRCSSRAFSPCSSSHADLKASLCLRDRQISSARSHHPRIHAILVVAVVSLPPSPRADLRSSIAESSRAIVDMFCHTATEMLRDLKRSKKWLPLYNVSHTMAEM